MRATSLHFGRCLGGGSELRPDSQSIANYKLEIAESNLAHGKSHQRNFVIIRLVQNRRQEITSERAERAITPTLQLGKFSRQVFINIESTLDRHYRAEKKFPRPYLHVGIEWPRPAWAQAEPNVFNANPMFLGLDSGPTKNQTLEIVFWNRQLDAAFDRALEKKNDITFAITPVVELNLASLHREIERGTAKGNSAAADFHSFGAQSRFASWDARRRKRIRADFTVVDNDSKFLDLGIIACLDMDRIIAYANEPSDTLCERAGEIIRRGWKFGYLKWKHWRRVIGTLTREEGSWSAFFQMKWHNRRFAARLKIICNPTDLRYVPRSFMAKKSWINRNERKRATVQKYAALRAELKAKKDYIGLAQMPRDASPTRVVNRCQVSGRRRAFIRRFKVSRLTFRELASAGMIPGVTKSSW
jgi:small subunit ribosomal protein S14